MTTAPGSTPAPTAVAPAFGGGTVPTATSTAFAAPGTSVLAFGDDSRLQSNILQQEMIERDQQ